MLPYLVAHILDLVFKFRKRLFISLHESDDIRGHRGYEPLLLILEKC